MRLHFIIFVIFSHLSFYETFTIRAKRETEKLLPTPNELEEQDYSFSEELIFPSPDGTSEKFIAEEINISTTESVSEDEDEHDFKEEHNDEEEPQVYMNTTESQHSSTSDEKTIDNEFNNASEDSITEVQIAKTSETPFEEEMKTSSVLSTIEISTEMSKEATSDYSVLYISSETPLEITQTNLENFTEENSNYNGFEVTLRIENDSFVEKTFEMTENTPVDVETEISSKAGTDANNPEKDSSANEIPFEDITYLNLHVSSTDPDEIPLSEYLTSSEYSTILNFDVSSGTNEGTSEVLVHEEVETEKPFENTSGIEEVLSIEKIKNVPNAFFKDIEISSERLSGTDSTDKPYDLSSTLKENLTEQNFDVTENPDEGAEQSEEVLFTENFSVDSMVLEYSTEVSFDVTANLNKFKTTVDDNLIEENFDTTEASIEKIFTTKEVEITNDSVTEEFAHTKDVEIQDLSESSTENVEIPSKDSIILEFSTQVNLSPAITDSQKDTEAEDEKSFQYDSSIEEPMSIKQIKDVSNTSIKKFETFAETSPTLEYASEPITEPDVSVKENFAVSENPVPSTEGESSIFIETASESGTENDLNFKVVENFSKRSEDFTVSEYSTMVYFDPEIQFEYVSEEFNTESVENANEVLNVKQIKDTSNVSLEKVVQSSDGAKTSFDGEKYDATEDFIEDIANATEKVSSNEKAEITNDATEAKINISEDPIESFHVSNQHSSKVISNNYKTDHDKSTEEKNNSSIQNFRSIQEKQHILTDSNDSMGKVSEKLDIGLKDFQESQIQISTPEDSNEVKQLPKLPIPSFNAFTVPTIPDFTFSFIQPTLPPIPSRPVIPSNLNNAYLNIPNFALPAIPKLSLPSLPNFKLPAIPYYIVPIIPSFSFHPVSNSKKFLDENFLSS